MGYRGYGICLPEQQFLSECLNPFLNFFYQNDTMVQEKKLKMWNICGSMNKRKMTSGGQKTLKPLFYYWEIMAQEMIRLFHIVYFLERVTSLSKHARLYEP